MTDERDAAAQQPLKTRRSDDYTQVYANNAVFEPSVWDLKIVFGELDLSAQEVEQHTAVTVPWSLAKLALYHLSMQVAAQEIINGKITMVPSVLPPEVPPPPPEQRDNETFQSVYRALVKIRDEFMKNA